MLLLRPANLVERVVDVVQEDLREPGAAAGRGRAEVGDPAVVRLQPGPTPLVVGGRRLERGEIALREERRHRVREEHLGDDALRLGLLQPALAVPVAVRGRRLQIGEGIDVRVGPGVELVVPARREVRLVLAQLGAGVTVDRDDRVPARRVRASDRSTSPSTDRCGRDASSATARAPGGRRRTVAGARLRVETGAQLGDRQRLGPEVSLARAGTRARRGAAPARASRRLRRRRRARGRRRAR